MDFWSDFANIDRVTVTFALGVAVNVIRVLPGLWNRSVIPDVTLVRKTVSHESKLSFFHVLWQEKINWITWTIITNFLRLFFRYSFKSLTNQAHLLDRVQLLGQVDLHLGVGPPGDFDNHVKDIRSASFRPENKTLANYNQIQNGCLYIKHTLCIP